jgi:hypothetical protein
MKVVSCKQDSVSLRSLRIMLRSIGCSKKLSGWFLSSILGEELIEVHFNNITIRICFVY